MATFKSLASSDIKTARSFLNQLIDVLQEDISGSTSRRKYQHFVTGGIGPGVTSSLFQTVYDQDFSLQTANPVFDITVGIAPPDLFAGTGSIAGHVFTEIDSAGKYLYPSSSLMMREKTEIYRQFSQTLLGDGNQLFKIPLISVDDSSQTTIDAAMFVAFKRLFSRDQIKRETFAMRFYQSGSDPGSIGTLYRTSVSGSSIYTDINSADKKFLSNGGQYGTIVDSANTTRQVGLIFYDAGVAVFDLEKITSGSQAMSGTIDAMHSIGTVNTYSQYIASRSAGNVIQSGFITSASIDNIVDDLCGSRFQSGSLTAITFQNVTNINSTLIFCRANADEFNYSSNPTFVDSDRRIVVIDQGSEDVQDTFTYVTTIGMYDSSNNLMAVAKLSRPVEKSPERDLTFRVRLDFAKKKSRSYTK